MMNRLGRVIIHDAYKEKDLAFLGTSSLGTPILINKAVCESDLVISIGNIGINFTGGYSGGGKNVFPGTAGVASIEHNHSFAIAADSPHQAGKTDGNYCRQDIEEIAQRVGLKFIINTVINREGKIATVVAGTPKTAFSTGTTVARKTHEARVESPLDIAVVHPGSATGSYDEAQKYRYLSFVLLVATLIAPSLKEQGTLILVAPNVRAWAPPFLAQETPPVEWLQYSLRELASMIASRKISPLRLANWAYAIRWVLTRREVLLVNDSLPSDQCIRYGFKQYTHIEDALSHAFSNQGACAQVGVFPEGAATIPVMDTNEKQLTTDELRRNGCGECQ